MCRRREFLCVVLVGVVCVFCAGAAEAQGPNEQPLDLSNINWQIGPGKVDLGAHAEIHLPKGYRLAGPDDARLLLEAMENPTSGNEFLVAPPSYGSVWAALFGSTKDWFVVFEFDPMGYVRDDEKDSLDADAMLKSIREGNTQSNKERQRRGWATLEVVGWEEPPNYDPETNNLVWAVRAQSEGRPVVNYNTRLLGRRGVMVVNLVADPDELAAAVPAFKDLLKGYSFKPGQRYAEFRAGDAVAKYGLTALVAGAAGAVAAKTGLLKWLWKFIVVGFIAVLAFFRNLLAPLFGWGPTPESKTPESES